MVCLGKLKSFNVLGCSAQWETAGNGAGKSVGFYPIGDKIPCKDSTSYNTWLDAHLYLNSYENG